MVDRLRVDEHVEVVAVDVVPDEVRKKLCFESNKATNVTYGQTRLGDWYGLYLGLDASAGANIWSVYASWEMSPASITVGVDKWAFGVGISPLRGDELHSSALKLDSVDLGDIDPSGIKLKHGVFGDRDQLINAAGKLVTPFLGESSAAWENNPGYCMKVANIPTPRFAYWVEGGACGWKTNSTCHWELWAEAGITGGVRWNMFGPEGKVEATVKFGGSYGCANGAEFDNENLFTVTGVFALDKL